MKEGQFASAYAKNEQAAMTYYEKALKIFYED